MRKKAREKKRESARELEIREKSLRERARALKRESLQEREEKES